MLHMLHYEEFGLHDFPSVIVVVYTVFRIITFKHFIFVRRHLIITLLTETDITQYLQIEIHKHCH